MQGTHTGLAIWRGKFLVELVRIFCNFGKIEKQEILWRHIAKPFPVVGKYYYISSTDWLFSLSENKPP
jgi:hypothetical protein